MVLKLCVPVRTILRPSFSSSKPSATQKLLRNMSLKSATMKVALVRLINHFLGW